MAYISGNSIVQPSHPRGSAAAGFFVPAGQPPMYSTRGRPRKDGARFPSGDLLPERDAGTPEQQNKRIALTGHSDDKRASYPLGVLYARRLLLQGDHYAGRRYAALYYAAVCRITIPTSLRDLVATTSQRPEPMADSDWGAEVRASYLAARQALEKLGGRIAAAVDDVCVFENPPRSPPQLAALAKGLDALFRHFEEADKLARAA